MRPLRTSPPSLPLMAAGIAQIVTVLAGLAYIAIVQPQLDIGGWVFAGVVFWTVATSTSTIAYVLAGQLLEPPSEVRW